MLNTLTKKMPWMVASLFVAASVFGQSKELAADSTCRPKPAETKSCPQPKCPPKPCCELPPPVQLNPAYNAPARVDVRGCWDLFFGASFIYWEAMQDNMEVGAQVSNATAAQFAGSSYTGASVVQHDFSYKPGFKVMAGMNFDHDTWVGYAEYTWYRSNTATSMAAGTPGAGAAGSVMPTSGNAQFLTSQAAAPLTGFNSGSQNWHLSFQSLDTAMARVYHVGTKLTFNSIMGFRFAWITQSKLKTFVADTAQTGVTGTTLGTYTQKQNYSSWGAGLLGGLNTNWILGEGFRMIGNGSVDILYTRMQTTNAKDKLVTAAGATTTYANSENRPDFLMPHANLEWGFGWGSYFDCNNWHIDLAATYCFQVFWNGNQFREFQSAIPTLQQKSDGNLYMHGLNATLRLDF